jgi:hypothetical protein
MQEAFHLGSSFAHVVLLAYCIGLALRKGGNILKAKSLKALARLFVILLLVFALEAEMDKDAYTISKLVFASSFPPAN